MRTDLVLFCFEKMETQGCPNFLVSAWGFRLVKSAEAVGEFGKSAGRCKQVNIGAMPCTQFDNGKILDGFSCLVFRCDAHH